MKLILHLKDRGDKWEIIRTREVAEELGIYALGDEQQLDIHSFSLYEYINNLLENNRQLFIPKHLEKELDTSDIVVLEESELDVTKRIAIKKVEDLLFGKVLTKLHLIDIYKFTVLNNFFVDKGFIITPNNREEKYIEIINYISEIEDEEESEKVIDKLEDYLQSIDKLSYSEEVIDNYKVFKSKIDECTTEEKVNELTSDLLSQLGN